jgi:diguanylate cyclase (GGDEF)-like protein
VDDAGAGHASMRVIAELRPEFIKVDRSLIHTVDSDRARRALVVALLSFGGHIGARLIAEGIETQRDQDALLSLGVQFGQGWHLGRPVLTAPMADQPGMEIADAAWFARRSVLGTSLAAVGPSPPRGSEAAGPLEKASPIAASGRRGRGLAHALSDVAHALQSEHDPLRILAVMGELMQRVVPVKEMCIFVAEYDTHRLVPVIATGPDRAELLADSFSLDAGLTGWAFAQGTAQNIANTSAHPLSRQVPGTSVIDESLLLVPLVAGEHKLGIINCWRPGVNRFTERELEAASLFAHIAAAAWRNAQLYTELLTAAMTDPLTRLHNSRWLHDAGERDLTRAAREGKNVAVLLVDLDHFKRVNDSSGHAAGDLALQRVATRLRSTVRGADSVVRLGGEEFVAVLYDCGIDGAAVVGEAMRVAVRDITMPYGIGIPQLTASIGIAVYPQHGTDLDHLLAAADRAMYSAKHDGRDRVERAGTPPGSGVIVPLPEDRRGTTARRLVADAKKLGSL